MRRVALLALTIGLTLTGLGGATAAWPATAHPAAGLTAAQPARLLGSVPAKTIRFGGYLFTVPADWPVYRLDQDPAQCVRYDRHAVYLGRPGASQLCPAHLVGRVDTVSVQTAASQAPPGPAAVWQHAPAAFLPGALRRDGTTALQDAADHQVLAAASRPGLTISATYAGSPALVSAIIRSARAAGAPAQRRAVPSSAGPSSAVPSSAGPSSAVPSSAGPSSAVPSSAGPSSAVPSSAVPSSAVPSSAVPSSAGPSSAVPSSAGPSSAVPHPAAQRPAVPAAAGHHPGHPVAAYRPAALHPAALHPAALHPAALHPGAAHPGAAHSAAWHRARVRWGFDTCATPSLSTMRKWRRHYSAVAVYLGGPEAACGWGNLSRRWVRTTTRMGWALIPAYVGRQAPCNRYSLRIRPRHSFAEGKAAAGQAVRLARSLGIGQHAPIYYDMEAYRTGSARCRRPVMSFLNGWTRQLHALGYRSGVYSSAGSAVADLRHTAHVYGRRLTRPDSVWFGLWDGRPDLFGLPYVPVSWWPAGHRIKQWQGNRWRRIGGVRLNIDSDIVAGAVYRLAALLLAGWAATAGRRRLARGGAAGG